MNLGDRCTFTCGIKRMGTVMYVGPKFSPPGNQQQQSNELYVGVEIDAPCKNGHDGLVDGKRYFHAKRGCGFLVPQSKVQSTRKSTASTSNSLKKASPVKVVSPRTRTDPNDTRSPRGVLFDNNRSKSVMDQPTVTKPTTPRETHNLPRVAYRSTTPPPTTSTRELQPQPAEQKKPFRLVVPKQRVVQRLEPYWKDLGDLKTVEALPENKQTAEQAKTTSKLIPSAQPSSTTTTKEGGSPSTLLKASSLKVNTPTEVKEKQSPFKKVEINDVEPDFLAQTVQGTKFGIILPDNSPPKLSSQQSLKPLYGSNTWEMCRLGTWVLDPNSPGCEERFQAYLQGNKTVQPLTDPNTKNRVEYNFAEFLLIVTDSATNKKKFFPLRRWDVEMQKFSVSKIEYDDLAELKEKRALLQPTDTMSGLTQFAFGGSVDIVHSNESSVLSKTFDEESQAYTNPEENNVIGMVCTRYAVDGSMEILCKMMDGTQKWISPSATFLCENADVIDHLPERK